MLTVLVVISGALVIMAIAAAVQSPTGQPALQCADIGNRRWKSELDARDQRRRWLRLCQLGHRWRV